MRLAHLAVMAKIVFDGVHCSDVLRSTGKLVAVAQLEMEFAGEGAILTGRAATSWGCSIWSGRKLHAAIFVDNGRIRLL